VTVVVDECSGWNVQAFFRGSLDWHWEVEGFIDLMFSSEKQNGNYGDRGSQPT